MHLAAFFESAMKVENNNRQVWGGWSHFQVEFEFAAHNPPCPPHGVRVGWRLLNRNLWGAKIWNMGDIPPKDPSWCVSSKPIWLHMAILIRSKMRSKFVEHPIKPFAINLWAQVLIRMNPRKLRLVTSPNTYIFLALNLILLLEIF